MNRQGFEPTAKARQDAAVMYDIYAAYVQAGFTEAQAVGIIQAMLSALVTRTNTE